MPTMLNASSNRDSHGCIVQPLLGDGQTVPGVGSESKGKLQSAWQGTRRYFSELPYKGYIAVERPGNRQRYLRNMSDQQWRQLYGHRYMYSSDYIHANPKSFSDAVGFGARLANRTEEWGELSFRFTGCFCRFLGGVVRGSLRELAGVPRFGADLRRYMVKLDPDLFAGVDPHVFSQKAVIFLCKKKMLNFHGSLSDKVDPALALELLQQCGVQGVTHKDDQRVVALMDGLKRADRLRKLQLNGTLYQGVMSVGCAMSAGAFTGLYLGTGLLLSGLDAAFLVKMGALAAGLYFSSFLLRSAVTALARTTKAYRGRPSTATGAIGKRQYASLFELSANWLRRFRNSIYQAPAEYLTNDPNYQFRSTQQLLEDDIVREIEFAQKMGAHIYRDPNAPMVYRLAMRASAVFNRLSDFVFSLDRVVAQVAVERPLKDNLFRYHTAVTHTPQLSVHNKCNIDLVYMKAANSRSGRFRQSLASFIGHGGADTLGMAVGCGFCSAMWTACNIGMGGSMFSVTVASDLTAPVGLGFASACAVGWGTSATFATVGHLGAAVADAGTHAKEKGLIWLGDAAIDVANMARRSAPAA